VTQASTNLERLYSLVFRSVSSLIFHHPGLISLHFAPVYMAPVTPKMGEEFRSPLIFAAGRRHSVGLDTQMVPQFHA